MKIDIFTLFPESFSSLKESIIARAVKNNIVEIEIHNIRDFSLNKHSKCDDEPFGGGAGMLMTAQPIYDAVMTRYNEKSKVIFPSPSGRVFTSKIAQELSKEEHLIFICGHYEGIDQRIIDIFNADEISIGDYVLTGGEIPTMAIVDSTLRFVEGVITSESLEEESFSSNALEYPQYTRPADFMGYKVPEVLLSGNHQEIAKWRKAKSKEKTLKVRPDLLGDKSED